MKTLEDAKNYQSLNKSKKDSSSKIECDSEQETTYNCKYDILKQISNDLFNYVNFIDKTITQN
jgi:hypothetical protein